MCSSVAVNLILVFFGCCMRNLKHSLHAPETVSLLQALSFMAVLVTLTCFQGHKRVLENNEGYIYYYSLCPLC